MTQVKDKSRGGMRKLIDFSISEKGCFECSSHIPGTGGYPRIQIRGKQTKMSRFVYKECFGDIPDGHYVLHKCDNPRCINPEHLFTGTAKENFYDMRKKGRENYAKGSQSGNSKLTEIEILEIKRMISKGISDREVAKKFPVSHHTIYEIRKGKTWKHVS
ncbi:HNH endonuclease [Paenibacillus sp. FSL R10-2791]|uniref:HNH endonuclease n=1 Tax=Paenibacillus sp. FSL R10-2791 TaxID=2954695 RepID=UPI0030F77661